MREEINVLYIVSEFPVIWSFYIYKCQPVIQKSQNGVLHSRSFAYSKKQKTAWKNEDIFNRLRRYLHRLTQSSSSAHEDIFSVIPLYCHHICVIAVFIPTDFTDDTDWVRKRTEGLLMTDYWLLMTDYWCRSKQKHSINGCEICEIREICGDNVGFSLRRAA